MLISNLLSVKLGWSCVVLILSDKVYPDIIDMKVNLFAYVIIFCTSKYKKVNVMIDFVFRH